MTALPAAPTRTTRHPEPLDPFVVRLPGFEGSLAELASALRAARLTPADVPLVTLTHAVFERAVAWRDTHPDAVTDLLPPLAAVIALKARLLLPRPEPEVTPDDAWDDLEEVVASVETLAELDTLVSFLSTRRSARAGLIPARPLDLGLPRRERRVGTSGLAKLVKAARQAVREVSVPLLSRERTTLQGALVALRAYGTRLRRFVFGSITVEDWGERTTYFSALLEGIRGGEFVARQDEPYGPIDVECTLPEDAGVERAS